MPRGAALPSLSHSVAPVCPICIVICPEIRTFRGYVSEGVYLGHVAIYCRVSTDDQSCERQERDLRAFAKRAGHHIVGVFKETASGAKNDRVERRKVMGLAQAREIDAILVTELSRWGRSTQDLVQTLDDLHSWKVSVLAQTGLSFDLSNPTDPLGSTASKMETQNRQDLTCRQLSSPRAARTLRETPLRASGVKHRDKGSAPSLS
jgi:putative DNA-invertase from lambdoid prophage Rac